MDARQVDALRYLDFCTYIVEIDRYWDDMEKRYKAQSGG